MKEYKDLTDESSIADSSTKFTVSENKINRHLSMENLNDEKYYLERKFIDIESEIRYCVTRIKDLKNDKSQLNDLIREKNEDIYELEKLIDKHNKLVEESKKNKVNV